jgi:hypothetical protein
MKKIMSLMLGLSLLVGTTALFADDKPADNKTDKTKTKKKGKKKKDTTDKMEKKS